MLAMGRDLRRFVAEYEQLGQFTTFIAAFKYPQSTSEAEFEQLMWKHLQMLHDEDPSDWDPHYSADPMAPNFAFSFAGKAFFVVGKHSGASRFSRRLGFAALVFNPESQIRRLIEEGGLKKFADTVRRRDIKYQGDINPSLPADSSTTGGESRVYSGMTHRTGEPWQCPFHPKAEILAAEAARKTEAGSTAVPPVVATAAAPPASGEDDGAKKPQG
jgi:FPC/CPF motif-containing protein YcgG